MPHPLGFSKRKLRTKFKVSSWSNFKDMFDCMQINLGVTWPRPRPFWRNLFERPLGIPQTKRCTKIEISSSRSFDDMFDCMPKIKGSRDLGHAPLGEIYWSAHRSAFPRWSRVPNLKSLAQVVLKISSIVFRKFQGSHDLGHAHFGKSYFSARSSFPRWSAVPKLKSLAHAVLTIFSIVCQKLRGHVT